MDSKDRENSYLKISFKFQDEYEFNQLIVNQLLEDYDSIQEIVSMKEDSQTYLALIGLSNFKHCQDIQASYNNLYLPNLKCYLAVQLIDQQTYEILRHQKMAKHTQPKKYDGSLISNEQDISLEEQDFDYQSTYQFEEGNNKQITNTVKSQQFFDISQQQSNQLIKLKQSSYKSQAFLKSTKQLSKQTLRSELIEEASRLNHKYQSQQNLFNNRKMIKESINSHLELGNAFSQNQIEMERNAEYQFAKLVKSNQKISNQFIQKKIDQQLDQLQSQYSQSNTDKSRVIYVRNINMEIIDKNMIFNVFCNYGIINTIVIFTQKQSALIEYSNTFFSQMALHYLNNQTWFNNSIKIFYSKYGQLKFEFIKNSKDVQIFIPQQINVKFQNIKIIYNKKLQLKGINPPTDTLYITNISKKINKQDFLKTFSQYGQIINYKYSQFIQNNYIKCYIQFAQVEQCIEAMSYLNFSLFEDKSVHLSFTTSIQKKV